MRLLAGLVAGFDWETELVGRRVALGPPHGPGGRAARAHGRRPCAAGASVACRRSTSGAATLHGIDWTAKVASAQVKSAILLAGLSAGGTTVVREAVTTRTHTEEMLAEAGADVSVEPWGEGRIVRVRASDAATGRAHRARRPVGVGLLRGGRGASSRAASSRWPGSTAARPDSAT